MHHLSNNRKNNYIVITAATLVTLATIIVFVISGGAITPVAATTTAGNTTTTSSEPSLSGIKLSSQPIYQERSPPGNITPINQTYISATHPGTGMLTLPNSTQTINTTSNATGVISFATFSGYAKETIRAANGETANLTAYEIIKFNNPATAPQGGAKNIVIAILQTNSTGMLAPLNGMILAGIDELAPNGDSHLTLWRWESGIPLPTGNNTTVTEQSPSSSLMNTTTTTNATAADTNVTAAATIPSEEEVVVEEQQQQATPTTPAP